MRKTTTAASWQRAMLHAWLGFMLLLAFYLLSFGFPRRAAGPPEGKERVERIRQDAGLGWTSQAIQD
jgi:hypothetical protein